MIKINAQAAKSQNPERNLKGFSFFMWEVSISELLKLLALLQLLQMPVVISTGWPQWIQRFMAKGSLAN